MTTPAEELREAAKRIRRDAAWPTEDLAVADWLEEVADDCHASLPAWVDDGEVVTND